MPKDSVTRREISDEEAAHWARYTAAAHAMQSGIEFSKDKSEQQPKHLRVGINTAKVETGAVVALLVEKGVITNEEFARTAADFMEREAAEYQRELSKELGTDVKLY